MKIVIAPDSFKNYYSAEEATKLIEKLAKKTFPKAEFDFCPTADGGEGTLEVLLTTGKFSKKYLIANNSDNNKIRTYYITDKKSIAIIEAAKFCGLKNLEISKLNPLITSTYGVGEAIKDAIKNNYTEIYIALGGSGCHDCGIGALSALNYDFFIGNRLLKYPTGKDLLKITKVEDNSFINRDKVEINFLTDVSNKLLGKNGGARTFSKQKGATKKQIIYLEKGSKKFTKLVQKTFNTNISTMQGSGACGGLGAGLSIFANSKFIKGSKFILEQLDFKNKIEDCQLILTGEGCFDKQTLQGKVVSGVIDLAQEQNKKVIAVCGKIDATKKTIKKSGLNNIYTLKQLENGKKILIK